MCFKNEFQKDNGFFVILNDPERTNVGMRQKISLCSELKIGFFIGKVVNHQSINLNDYIKHFGYDHVYKETVSYYFDPFHHDHLWKTLANNPKTTLVPWLKATHTDL